MFRSVPANQRKRFSSLLYRLEPGDVLLVTKLDRLGRNSHDMMTRVDSHSALGVKAHCLALGGGYPNSSAGRMTMFVVAPVSQFELDLLKERTFAGLAGAKASGKTVGRSKALTQSQKDILLVKLSAGASVSSVAREMKVSRATVIRPCALAAASAS